MTKLEKYHTDKQAMTKRVNDLRQSIAENEKQIVTMESDYKAYVVNGQDDKADDLFPEMEQKQTEINGQKHKLETLSEINSEAISNLAIAAVNEIHEVKSDFKDRSRVITDEIEKAKQNYIKACNKAKDFNIEFLNTKDQYEDVLETERLNRNDVDTSTYILLTQHMELIKQDFDLKGVN